MYVIRANTVAPCIVRKIRNPVNKFKFCFRTVILTDFKSVVFKYLYLTSYIYKVRKHMLLNFTTNYSDIILRKCFINSNNDNI